MRTWARVLPNYQIKEWNETNLPPENAYLREVYSKRLWSKVSNYVRLYALLTEGGLYFDTDVEVLKSFDPLLKDECFVGFQVQNQQTDWVNNAVIGAVPGHPFMKQCLDYTVRAFDGGAILRSPQVTTSVLLEQGLQAYGFQTVGGVTLYPTEYFYPYAWYEQFSADSVTANTYAIHRWEGSWIKSKSPIPRTLRYLRDILPWSMSRNKPDD